MFVLSSLHQAFKCRICDKTFFNRKSLLNHLVQCQQNAGAEYKMLGFGVCHLVCRMVGVMMYKLTGGISFSLYIGKILTGHNLY